LELGICDLEFFLKILSDKNFLPSFSFYLLYFMRGGNRDMKTYLATKRRRTGVALILTMIILAIIAAMAVSLASIASTNLQITDNRQKASNALACAHSGLDVMKYFLNGTNASTGSQCLGSIATELNSRFAADSISSINFTSTGTEIDFAQVPIDSTQNQSFTASLSQLDDDTVRLSVTGFCGSFSKTITTDLNVVSRGNSVFNYGVASKGALQMSGQAEITGVDLAVASSVYIDGGLSGDSFSITNQASVAGNVYIANPYATVSIGSMAVVGGESGAAAYNHVILDTAPAQFPTPNPSFFESYATGPVITSQEQVNGYAVLNNAKIAPNTNPTFASDITINGVLFIEQPNIVTFSGQATVRGIIVGDGVVGPSTSDNKLLFSGQVECFDVSGLSGAEFDDIKQQTGTFIIAPGFSAEFSGQTDVSNGVIAASGIKFTGQAGGTINGSMINYSSQPVILSGQSNLFFNRSGTEINPAGFSPVKQLDYLPDTYTEPTEP
jgi:Tfp pilus assembly protein PilX